MRLACLKLLFATFKIVGGAFANLGANQRHGALYEVEIELLQVADMLEKKNTDIQVYIYQCIIGLPTNSY